MSGQREHYDQPVTRRPAKSLGQNRSESRTPARCPRLAVRRRARYAAGGGGGGFGGLGGGLGGVGGSMGNPYSTHSIISSARTSTVVGRRDRDERAGGVGAHGAAAGVVEALREFSGR